MRLTISNLAWDLSMEPQVLALLAKRKISAIEIAPTKIWPDWKGVSKEATADYLKSLGGTKVSSFQSLLFGKPHLSVFGSDAIKQETLEHLGLVAKLAAWLKAGPLVFGSPKNRDPGDRSYDAAFAEATEFFRQAGEVCAKEGVTLCLEANPEQYASRFITSGAQAADLVRAVDHEGFKLHLDTACMHLAGDDYVRLIADNMDILHHFHISEPNLATFANPQCEHRQISDVLARAGYDGYISIEMLNKENSMDAIVQALDFVITTYQPEGSV